MFQIVAGSNFVHPGPQPGGLWYQYWQVYWAGSVVSIALRFAVILRYILTRYSVLPWTKELSRVLFRWASALLLLVAIVVAAHTPD